MTLSGYKVILFLRCDAATGSETRHFFLCCVQNVCSLCGVSRTTGRSRDTAVTGAERTLK